MIKIATWNVNSIRSRIELISHWLTQSAPDIVCFQEIKCLEHDFPFETLQEQGYSAICWGQKSYNGVAIVARLPLSDAHVNFGTTPTAQDEARYLEALITLPSGQVMIVASLYAPNGNPIGSEKYQRKESWFRTLLPYARAHVLSNTPFVLAGDFNIIPTPRDAARPEAWMDDALFTPDMRALYATLLHMGYTDSLSTLTQTPPCYTFWDYKNNSFSRGNGIRIDHILTNPAASDLLHQVGVDQALRAMARPSDHAPVWATFNI